MSDLAIKLFGQTILPLALDQQQEDVSCANKYESCSRTPPISDSEDCYVNPNIAAAANTTTTSLHDNKSQREQEEQEVNREPSGEENTNSKQADDQTIQNSIDPASSNISQNLKTTSVERETSSLQKSRKTEEQKSDQTSISEEKTLKKPDKILPCPRCDSMDTKFCYYNNYNVNQPRHFCKNCQRYWTAGGTMRNVPVGAGRRKNKSSSVAQYSQLIVSQALRTGQVHAMNGFHNPSPGNNGTVLTFCSDPPRCESVASVLQLSEKTQNNVQNGYHRPEHRILVSCGGTADTGDDSCIRISATASNSSEKGGNGSSGGVVNNKNYQSFLPQVPCFPELFPWNSAIYQPTFCPSGFPVSFYPAPTYWGCTVPSPWNVPPCISPTSPSLNHSAQSSSPTSPLGKHSRDGKILNPVPSKEPPTPREGTKSENGVLVRKTLRIDDPNEAAKSSIWATLGISKSERSDSLNAAGLFKGFQSKDQDKSYMAGTSSVLQANPAAFSRSLNFQESSC